MDSLKDFFKAFCLGAICYPGLEILWRRRSHWTMSLTGGLCAGLVVCLNKKLRKQKLLSKCALDALSITSVEFIAGLILNKKLQLNIWDYSRQPLNIMGQICPLYTLLWFLLCIPPVAYLEKQQISCSTAKEDF